MVQEQPTIVEERLRAALEPEQPVAEVASPVVAEALVSAVADFDLSTPAGIKAAAEQFPALKNWRETYEWRAMGRPTGLAPMGGQWG